MDTKLMEEFEELEGQLADVDESKVCNGVSLGRTLLDLLV